MDPNTVRAASAGDLSAFARLVDASAPTAAAVALARTGHPEVAEEVAQEAFLDAWRLLPTLREPRAFTAWLRRIVIKHADRVTRRPHRDAVSWDGEVDGTEPHTPEGLAQGASARRGVARAIAALPPHQREVVALFYLSGRSHADIAALLGLSTAAIKKRLHDARRRLAPLLEEDVTWNLATLPLRIRAFVAARAGRVDLLADALDADPSLIDLRTPIDPEMLQTRYVPTGATLLQEAISYGHVDVVSLLIDRGAKDLASPADQPLLLAVEQDHPAVIDLLLARGANPNTPMWHGGTALHIASRRRRDGLVAQLEQHGADPTIRDTFGRTPADWRALHPGPAVGPPTGRVIDASGRALDGGEAMTVAPRTPGDAPDLRVRETGIKVLDLLVPMARGGVHRLVAGPHVGKIVLIGELGQRLGPTIVAGLLDRTWDVRDFEAVLRELGVWDGAVVVLGTDLSAARALVDTALGLAEAHDGWVIADDRLLEPLTDAVPRVPVVVFGPHVHPEVLPDPSDVVAQWVLDPERARQRAFPAVDPTHSVSSLPLEPEHGAVVAQVREALTSDPARAERLLAWFTQPFWVAEHFNGRPGVSVPREATLRDARALLAGAADHDEVASLRYRGTLEGAVWPTAERAPLGF